MPFLKFNSSKRKEIETSAEENEFEISDDDDDIFIEEVKELPPRPLIKTSTENATKREGGRNPLEEKSIKLVEDNRKLVNVVQLMLHKTEIGRAHV